MFTEKKVKFFPKKWRIQEFTDFDRDREEELKKKRLLPVRNLPATEGEMNRILWV